MREAGFALYLRPEDMPPGLGKATERILVLIADEERRIAPFPIVLRDIARRQGMAVGGGTTYHVNRLRRAGFLHERRGRDGLYLTDEARAYAADVARRESAEPTPKA